MKKYLISIITVTYNCKPALERTVASVRGQSHPHIEHIIIDGGSNDGTAAYLEEHSSWFSFWQSKPDKGLYDAMNQGLDQASGDFCVFLNAGDLFYAEDTLSRMMESVLDPNVYYFGTAIMTDGQHIYRLNPAAPIHGQVSYNGGLPNHQASLFPRSFYQKERYDLSFKMAADDDYKIRALKKCKGVHLDLFAVIFNIDGMSRNLTRWKYVRNRFQDAMLINKKHFRDDVGRNWRTVKYLLKTIGLFGLQKITGPHWRYEMWFNKFHRIPKEDISLYRSVFEGR